VPNAANGTASGAANGACVTRNLPPPPPK
jgi:hypothetical protein